MAMRYFKSSNGTVTVFRASATRSYTFAGWISTKDGCGVTGDIGFSNALRGARYTSANAVEITKAEYEALQAAKRSRVAAAGGAPEWATSPQNSWVRNSDLRN